MESLISHKSLGTIEVEVPAGVFTAHHFQSTREVKSKMKMKGVPEMPAMPETTIEQDIYVAKDIGLVKLVTKTPSINKTILSTQELISYSSGKE